jgi:hypothetical protein
MQRQARTVSLGSLSYDPPPTSGPASGDAVAEGLFAVCEGCSGRMRSAGGIAAAALRGYLQPQPRLPLTAGTRALVPMLAEPTSTQREAFDLIGAPIPVALK